MSARHIRDIEAGRIIQPRPSTVRLLADAFGLHGVDRDLFCRSVNLDEEPATAGARTRQAAPGVAAQLPLDVNGFSGRRYELELLDSIMSANADQPTAAVVAAPCGTAGVGKTAAR